MTTLYFIRHAAADSLVLDQHSRPLTEKGLQDSLNLAKDFANKNIDLVVSSPYRRSLETVAGIAAQHNLSVRILEDLRGLRIQSNWITSYREFFMNYWNDFNYHYSDGESFAELQKRSIGVVQNLLQEKKEKTIVIGTHSVSMAVIMKYYFASFSFQDFMLVANTEPYVVQVIFDENNRAMLVPN